MVAAAAAWTESPRTSRGGPRGGRGGRPPPGPRLPFTVGELATGTVLEVKPEGAVVEVPLPPNLGSDPDSPTGTCQAWLPARQLTQLEDLPAVEDVVKVGSELTAVVLATRNGLVLGTKMLEETPGDVVANGAEGLGGPGAEALAAKWLQEHNERRDQRRAQEAEERGGDRGGYGRDDRRRDRRERGGSRDLSGLQAGDVVRGTVQGLREFGAFVRLDSGPTGLLHISQISNERVEDVSDVFAPGDAVTALVIRVEDDRLSLSTRKLERSPGAMLSDPQSVYEGAEEAAAAYASDRGGDRPQRRERRERY